MPVDAGDDGLACDTTARAVADGWPAPVHEKTFGTHGVPKAVCVAATTAGDEVIEKEAVA